VRLELWPLEGGRGRSITSRTKGKVGVRLRLAVNEADLDRLGEPRAGAEWRDEKT
jgi:hypothetical protein